MRSICGLSAKEFRIFSVFRKIKAKGREPMIRARYCVMFNGEKAVEEVAQKFIVASREVNNS